MVIAVERVLALVGAAALGLACGALVGILKCHRRAARTERGEIPQSHSTRVGAGRGDERPAA
jgi:hypothetical protein